MTPAAATFGGGCSNDTVRASAMSRPPGMWEPKWKPPDCFYRRQTTDLEHSAALLQGPSKLVSCEWPTDSSSPSDVLTTQRSLAPSEGRIESGCFFALRRNDNSTSALFITVHSSFVRGALPGAGRRKR